MPIDIRATVTCSLGTLLSGSINDDYVQGTGLIKTRGSVEISGIVTPALGTAVTFSYTKGGTTRSIPRKLRVLSSFADPFRRTTRVELGCKLTYLSDKREKIDWKAFDDTANSGFTEADAKIVTLPIRAASVMSKCLTELGITASSSPLTSKFSVAAFDLSPGYVNVLSDLLISECWCGYLDANEVLQLFSLDQAGGSGPLLDKAKIIDLGSIGVGQLPGEAVTVSYSTLKLQKPDALNTTPGSSPWDKIETTNIYEIQVPYVRTIAASGSTPSVSFNDIKRYNILRTVSVETRYISIRSEVDSQPKRVVKERITLETTSSVELAGGLVTEYLTNNISFDVVPVVKRTTETYSYDRAGNEIKSVRYVEGSVGYLAGSAGVPYVFSPLDYVTVYYSNVSPLEREEIESTYNGSRKVTFIKKYAHWSQSITGQQTIAASNKNFSNATQVANFLNEFYAPNLGLALVDNRVIIERTSEPQTAPDQVDIINGTNADGGDPNNGWRTESTAELELALGSATAQRRIELSLPYAPDDVFSGPSGGPFTSIASDAPQKAKRFGVVQNRLLLGNRSGMNIQTAPELLPATPFAAFLVQANGVSGLYRTNGTSWTMSSEGVVVSTDALFWGAVGGTGDFFFPVAPGITTLPVTPPAVDGVVEVPSVVPVWNETALLDARTRTVCSVVGLSFALQLNTPLTLVTKAKAAVVPVVYVNAPVASVALAALAPAVSTGASVAVPVAAVSVAAVAPAVQTALVVEVPTASVSVAALVPEQVGRPRIEVAVPAAVIEVAGLAPVVLSGTFLEVPAAQITITALPPRIGGPDFWSSWAQQNYGWWPESYGEWWAN